MLGKWQSMVWQSRSADKPNSSARTRLHDDDSQISRFEFEHTVMVLPAQKINPVLSRELVFSRASLVRKKNSLYLPMKKYGKQRFARPSNAKSWIGKIIGRFKISKGGKFGR